MAKEHTYPKTQNSEMGKVARPVIGDVKKQQTPAGPHLKQGQGTPYEQMKLGKGFLLQDPRGGHTQKGNIDKE